MDTDERFLAPTDYKKALNCRISKSDEGNDGIVENIRSNKYILNTNLGISNPKVIGAYEDFDNGVVIYFVAGDNNHGIYRFDPKTETVETIYRNILLNFNKENLITGINVVGSDEQYFPLGMLYWTDDINPPRKLNIKKAIDFSNGTGGYSNIDIQTLDAVKYPPFHPPTFQGVGVATVPGFLTDEGVLTNQLLEKSFQFKYRWVYDDLEKSAWSPISKGLVDVGFNRYYDIGGSESSDNNVISVEFNTGHETVKRIQIAARNTNGKDDFVLIADIDKENVTEYVTGSSVPFTFNSITDFGNTIIIDDTLADNQSRYFLFYNDGIYSTIDVVESEKLYDDVPHLAKAQEVVDGNRMVYGNVVSGQDGVSTDVELKPVVVENPTLVKNITTFNLEGRHRVSFKFGDPDGPNNNPRHKFRMEYELEIIFPDTIVIDPGSISVFKIEIRNWQVMYSVVQANVDWGDNAPLRNSTGTYDPIQTSFYGHDFYWGQSKYGTAASDTYNMFVYDIDYTHTTSKTDLNDIREDIASELSVRYLDTTDNSVKREELFTSGSGDTPSQAYGLVSTSAASNGQTQPFAAYSNSSGNLVGSNPSLNVVGHSFHQEWDSATYYAIRPTTGGSFYLNRIVDGDGYAIANQAGNDFEWNTSSHTYNSYQGGTKTRNPGDFYWASYNSSSPNSGNGILFRDEWHPLNEVSLVNGYSSLGDLNKSGTGVQVSAGQKYDPSMGARHGSTGPDPNLDNMIPGIYGPNVAGGIDAYPYDNSWGMGASSKSFWCLRENNNSNSCATAADMNSIAPPDANSCFIWVSRGRVGGCCGFSNAYNEVVSNSASYQSPNPGNVDFPGSLVHNNAKGIEFNMCPSDKTFISNLYFASHTPIILGIEVLKPSSSQSVAVAGTFKAGSNHRFGLVYYDRANRSCAVQLGRKSTIYIPKASQSKPFYDNINYDTGASASALNSTGYLGEWNIQWEINHIPPVWATHYQWVYGGNALADNFIHFVTDGIFDGNTGAFLGFSDRTDNIGAIIPDDIYRDNIMVDITNIRKHNKGEGSGSAFYYDFVEGDILRFVSDQGEQPAIDNNWEFKVLGIAGKGEYPRILQSGENISPGFGAVNPFIDDKEFLVLSREIALITGPDALDAVNAVPSYVDWSMEIYSPKKKTEEESPLYFEIGEVGQIGNPYQDTRFHRRIESTYQNQDPSISQPATGVFKKGDIYLRYRNSYSNKSLTIVESFHFNDKFLSDFWNKGRPNAVQEDFRRSRKHSTCLYSDAYIPNTNINGISSIYPDVNFAEFERSYNSIQKLHSKDNMLVIFQEDKVSQSLVNRDVIFNVDGSGNVATSDSVLSQAVPYLGRYGINKNPESFAYNGNRMYFVDIKRGAVLRLAQDGFTEISNNKMREYFTDKATQINNANIAANRFNIYGVYDIRFNEYIVAFEKINICPPTSTGPTWDCVDGACVKFCDNSGTYTSLADCYNNCGATGSMTSNLLPPTKAFAGARYEQKIENESRDRAFKKDKEEELLPKERTSSSTSSTTTTATTSTPTSSGSGSSGGY